MDNAELDALDDSRIHPETYRLANALAAGAVGLSDPSDIIAVDKAMAQPAAVEGFDLQACLSHMIWQSLLRGTHFWTSGCQVQL